MGREWEEYCWGEELIYSIKTEAECQQWKQRSLIVCCFKQLIDYLIDCSCQDLLCYLPLYSFVINLWESGEKATFWSDILFHSVLPLLSLYRLFFCLLFLSDVAEQVFVYAEQAVDILSTGSICEHQGLIAVCIDPSVISWCSLLCRPANNQHPLCACSRSLSSLSLSFPSSSPPPPRPVSCLLPQRQAPLYHCSPAVQQEQRRRLLAPWERSGGNGEGEKVGALLWKWHGEMSMRKKKIQN